MAAQNGRKRPADAAALRNMLAAIEGGGLRALRDRPILAIGMAAALRRSGIVALQVEHVGIISEGLRLTIAHSKTDQARHGTVVVIPEGSRIRPKALLLAWIAAAGHVEGPLFRRLSRCDALTAAAMFDRAIARLVQHYAAAAGYDPAEFAGHSLRSGFLTEGAAQGATIFKLQEVSRHKSVQVLSEYVRNAELFKRSCGATVPVASVTPQRPCDRGVFVLDQRHMQTLCVDRYTGIQVYMETVGVCRPASGWRSCRQHFATRFTKAVEVYRIARHWTEYLQNRFAGIHPDNASMAAIDGRSGPGKTCEKVFEG